MIMLSGCATKPDTASAGYKKVDLLKEYLYANNASYARGDEKSNIIYSDLIFKGIVLDSSEYLVNDKYSTCVGIIKYRITDVIYSKDANVKIDDEISILTTCTSRRWREEAIKQNVNEEYIILARIDPLDDERDPYRYIFSITKYCLVSPTENVISIKDENVMFHEVFSTLLQKAQASKRIAYKDNTVDCYVMNEQDFIRELKILIEQYKKLLETVAPAETGLLAEPPLSGETTAPPEMTASVETTTPAETTEPTESATPEESTTPSESIMPMDSTTSADATAPS
jgi:hypothetical protein